MENYSKTEENTVKETSNLQKDEKPIPYCHNLAGVVIHGETESDLNADILKITLKIKDQYPELSKYIEEMPETIAVEKNPEMSLKNLKTYYDSLDAMLNKYILEHSDSVK